jgi:hypothetical protein
MTTGALYLDCDQVVWVVAQRHFYGKLCASFANRAHPMAHRWTTCLVLMPFGRDFDDIYRLEVEPAILEAGLQVLRSELSGTRIWDGLRTADIIVADVTGKNPNLFYALGVAQGAGKPTLLISRTQEDVPFDLSHLRVLLYDPEGAGTLYRNLKDALRRTIEASSDRLPNRRMETSSKIDHVPKSDVIKSTLDRANQAMAQGNYETATASLLEAAAIQRESNDLLGFAKTLNFLGSAYQTTGQFDAALASLQQALEILRKVGEPRSLAAVLGNLANVLSSTGDFQRAQQFWTDGPTPRLSPDQLAELAKIVETGPDRKVDGVVRWRICGRKWRQKWAWKRPS